MARLVLTPNLTSGYAPDVAQTIKRSHRGQAHFANGPLGATCNDCVFYGAWKRIRNASGEIVNTRRVQGACEKYRELMGKVGPAIPPDADACKYFERKNDNGKGDRDL